MHVRNILSLDITYILYFHVVIRGFSSKKSDNTAAERFTKLSKNGAYFHKNVGNSSLIFNFLNQSFNSYLMIFVFDKLLSVFLHFSI